MLSGTTSTGFVYNVDVRMIGDFRYIQALRDMKKDDLTALADVAELLLGSEQLNKLIKHVQDEAGFVNSEKIMEEISEIMSGHTETKN